MTPLTKYNSDLNSGRILSDNAQKMAVELLNDLYFQLVEESPPGLFKRLLGKRNRINGVYMWGGVGRGKTYLVDNFYETLPFDKKLRVHYHRFMLDMHEQLRVLPKSPDPLKIIGKKIADDIRVLCIDEFHVTDVADAMLLSGLLQALFANGVSIVATSNTRIDDLYLNGLQRERFMSAISLLKENMTEFHLDAEKDFRLEHLERGQTYIVATGNDGFNELSNKFNEMASTKVEYKKPLIISKRSIDTIAYADDIVWFDFNALCNTHRSAQDYLELALEFHTIFVSDIPHLEDAQDSAAKRFMHLVDALYDHRVKLVLTAVVSVNKLYAGRLLKGAFDRTVSRLIEMGSHDYIAEAHR